MGGSSRSNARRPFPSPTTSVGAEAGSWALAPVHPTLAHRTPLGRRSGRDRPEGAVGRDQLVNRRVERDVAQNAGYFAEEAGAARSLQLLSP